MRSSWPTLRVIKSRRPWPPTLISHLFQQDHFSAWQCIRCFGLNQVCSVSLMHVQVAIVASKSVILNDVIVLSFSFCISHSNSAFTPTPNYTHTHAHTYITIHIGNNTIQFLYHFRFKFSIADNMDNHNIRELCRKPQLYLTTSILQLWVGKFQAAGFGKICNLVFT